MMEEWPVVGLRTTGSFEIGEIRFNAAHSRSRKYAYIVQSRRCGLGTLGDSAAVCGQACHRHNRASGEELEDD
jgi:hypothetical protein